MAVRTDTFDLGALRLNSGEGRRLELSVAVPDFELAGETYRVGSSEPGSDLVDVKLDISRMTGQGYALHIRFGAVLSGRCMRCLDPAAAQFDLEAREVSQPGEGEELESPYVSSDEVLDLASWVHDVLGLALPATIVCKDDCKGLCSVCGENLNSAAPDHDHPSAPDPRWAELDKLKFEQ
ncbi:MAG: DUF177 domain-containing protein [Solirubrobacterales bacterium]|nr:DUF177 domain-containing protein [Solirubrobacterales bacterium]